EGIFDDCRRETARTGGDEAHVAVAHCARDRIGQATVTVEAEAGVSVSTGTPFRDRGGIATGSLETGRWAHRVARLQCGDLRAGERETILVGGYRPELQIAGACPEIQVPVAGNGPGVVEGFRHEVHRRTVKDCRNRVVQQRRVVDSVESTA